MKAKKAIFFSTLLILFILIYQKNNTENYVEESIHFGDQHLMSLMTSELTRSNIKYRTHNEVIYYSINDREKILQINDAFTRNLPVKFRFTYGSDKNDFLNKLQSSGVESVVEYVDNGIYVVYVPRKYKDIASSIFNDR